MAENQINNRVVTIAGSIVCLIIAAILWTIGELGTFGAFVPNNGGWASFQPIFIFPWISSIIIALFWGGWIYERTQ